MDKPTLALFDFDGTITRSDTLPLFIRHAVGWGGYLLAMITTLPAMIILACNGWKSCWGIDAGATKALLLRRCFMGKTPAQVERMGNDFVAKVDAVLAPHVMQRLREHLDAGHQVAIVSASVDVWVRPWAVQQGVTQVIATRLHKDEKNRYTGQFDGANCNGSEKVNRIAALYNRNDYHIVAYGNSSGDYPMFDYAHEAYLCSDKGMSRYK